jgi:arsenate reductase (thioredoxin)
MSNLNAATLIPSLHPLVAELIDGISDISAERNARLEELADITARHLSVQQSADLTFICTHNSRRSHLSQILAQTAAAYHGIAGVACHSGGTEATACNPRSVAAFRRAGFEVANTTEGDNPVYEIRISVNEPPLRAWSKVYNEDGNPTAGYIGVMTCTHADENCPIVHGAAERFSLPFVDPKEADDTPAESATYDERLRQIGSEMFLFMAAVKTVLGRNNHR